MKSPNTQTLNLVVVLGLSLGVIFFVQAWAAAERLGAGRVVDRVVQEFPVSGIKLEVLKVVDPATGQGYLVCTDMQGKRRDLESVAAEEETAKVAKYGKIDPRLHDNLSQMREEEKLPVSIWLNVPDLPLKRPEADAAMTAEAIHAAVVSHLDTVKRHMAPKRQGVVDTLARMGVEARVPQYGPAVFAELTPGQIRMISHHPDVGAIYGPEIYTLYADDGCTTHRAYRAWQAGNLGFSTSSRPVVHEPDGVANYNPYLNNEKHPVIYWKSKTKNIGDHATEVAGVIASTHPLFRGMAPSAQLIFSANSQDFSDANLVDALEWAYYNGGNPINMSWGTVCGGFQTFMSRYVDWAISNLWVTFVISAGNLHPDCTNVTDNEQVSSPGLAWGAITVGSQEDDNSGFWSGDSWSTFSKWRNPDFASGMEKPEVVAVGQDVRTTDAAGGDHLTAVGVNGTSFSAPMVAGQVAQLLSRRPGQNIWPEANKAAVLASAFHDIETGRDKDGVGSVVMNISDDTYRLGRFRNTDWSVASNFPVQYLDVVSLTAGQRCRVAIAWDSWSTGGGGTDQLGADIDLYIIGPTGSTVASSISISNAWEMVDFVAPASGTYDIRIVLFSYVPGWPGTYLGTAWATYNVPNFCTGYVSVPATGGTFTVNTANGSTFFDAYPGVGWSESGREKVYRLNLTTTKDIAVTDTNADLDLFVLQFPSCGADPIVPTVKGYGMNSVSINDASAGIYWIVVDGWNGYVGTTSMTVSVTGP